MIKKLNLLRMLVMLSFLTLFALSCKKDDAKESENPLNDAKAWYTKLTANAKTALTASNNNTQNITKEFLWNKAQIFKFSDGKDVIGTPINVFMTNHKAANGSYMLLIYKTDHDYHSQIIYNAKNNYFSKVTTTDIEAAFMVSEKNNELKSLAKGKKMTSKGTDGKVMVRQDEPPVCTDWYWTTYTYDQWGNITSILSEVYVYTTCEENGGGGDGDTPPLPDEDTMDWGSPTDENYQIENNIDEEMGNVSPGLDDNGDKYEKRRYSWTFHRSINEGFWLRSYEEGRVKKQGTDPWKFWDFQHLLTSPVGLVGGREIEIVNIDTDVEFSASSARVNLWYKIHRIGTGFGTTVPYYSSDFTKDKTFKPDDNQ